MQNIVKDEPQVPAVLTSELARKLIKEINGRKVAYIPEGVEEIADGCFRNTGVEEVQIPESVKDIKEKAFH